ncbi:MAG: type II secretion system protein [Patescibacteria group bacterium]|jgi:type II secretory pathway pseudopilin PulG
MNRSIKKSKKGFTLIEILVYMGIVVGILIAASTFAWNIIGSKTKSQAMQEVQANAYIVMERITHDIRNASDVDPRSAFEINIADPRHTSEAFILTAQEVSITPIVYTVDNGTLYVSHGGGAPVSVTSNIVEVTDLTLSDLSSPAGTTKQVLIQLSLIYRNPSQQNSRHAELTLTTSAEIRNILR